MRALLHRRLEDNKKDYMGSFNATCFASLQTIAPGDKCIVIPLTQKTSQEVPATFRGQAHSLFGITSSTCYPTSFWRPAGPFFDAEYDDYGRVMLADSPDNLRRLMFFLGYVLSSTATVALGENQYHDLAFDFPAFLAEKAPALGAWLQRKRDEPEVPVDAKLFFEQGVACWDYLWEVASEHRLFGLNTMHKLVPLEFAVMHKAAHDALVAEIEKGKDWHGHTLAQRPMFDRLLTAATEESRAYKEGGDPHGMHGHIFVGQLREGLRSVGGFEGGGYPGENEALNAYGLRFAKGELTADQMFKGLQPYLDARYVMAGLEQLNLRLSPMVYAPQDYSNEIGRAYAKFVRSTCAAVNKSVRERYRG